MDRAPSLIRGVLKYFPQYLGGLGCLLLVDYLNLFIPQFTGEITDGLQSGSFGLREILLRAGLIVGVAVIIALLRLGWRVLIFGASRQVERDLREQLYAHLTTLHTGFFQHNKTGDLMAYFTNDMDAIRMAVGPAILTTFDAVVLTVMVLTKMIVYVDLKLTLLAILPLLVILVGSRYYGKTMGRRFSAKQEAFSALSDRVQESVSGIRVVKAFVQEAGEMAAFEEKNRQARAANLGVVKLRAIVLPLLDGLIGAATALTLLYGGYLVMQGTVSLGRFVAFNTYVMILVWPMMAAGESITLLSQGAASWRRVKEILERETEIHDDDLTDTSIETLGSDIEFRDLHFRYAPELPEVFSGFSATIPQGATVGILGRTGCGKSTLASLLSRLYDVEPGQIFIGGRDIREIPIGVLREHMAVAPQENLLFSDTLQTNIAFASRTLETAPPAPPAQKVKLFIGKSEAAEQWVEQELTDRESENDRRWADLPAVEEAAKAADIHDNIVEFPKQYATVVGERGVTLSGGQKQRTAIARALMKDAEILILDDALSAVDTDTEAHILSALQEKRRGKTTLLIAHRVSTVQNADQILLIDEGVCKEMGTHQELMALDGLYARLFRQQQLELQRQAEKEALHAEA